LHALVETLERIRHPPALVVRHNRIVASVNEKHGHGDGVRMLDRRALVDRWITDIADPEQALAIAGPQIGVEAEPCGFLDDPVQIGKAGYRHGAAVDSLLQTHAGERGIAAVARAHDTDARRVDQALPGEIS